MKRLSLLLIVCLFACKQRGSSNLKKDPTELETRRGKSVAVADAIARLEVGCNLGRDYTNKKGQLANTSGYTNQYKTPEQALRVYKFFNNGNIEKHCKDFPLVRVERSKEGAVVGGEIFEYTVTADLIQKDPKTKKEKIIYSMRWRLNGLQAPLIVKTFLVLASKSIGYGEKRSFLEISDLDVPFDQIPFLGTPTGFNPLFLPRIGNAMYISEAPEEVKPNPYAPQANFERAPTRGAPKKGSLMLTGFNLGATREDMLNAPDTESLLATKFFFNAFDDIRHEDVWKDRRHRPVIFAHCESGCDIAAKITAALFDFLNYDAPRNLRIGNFKVSRNERPFTAATRFMPNIPADNSWEHIP